MSEGLQSAAHEIHEPTGLQPVVVQFIGLADEDELMAHIEKLKSQDA